MKRLFFILIGFIFLFLSCDETTYSVLIENKSEIPVKYSYKDEPNTLEPGTSKSYRTGGYTQPPKNIDVDGTMKIKMLSQGNTYTFVDIDESDIFFINVNNTLAVDVILRSDKFIDNNGSIEVNVPAKTAISPDPENPNDNIRIYTAIPRFSTFPQYNIDWGFNEERTVINVTIRL